MSSSAKGSFRFGIPRRKLKQVLPAILTLFTVAYLAKIFWINNQQNGLQDVERQVLVGGNQVHVVGGKEANQEKENKWFFDTSVKIDWHNYTQMELDRARKGPGEQGQAVILNSDEKNSKAERELFAPNGFSGLVSDMIALDRSVNDIRHKDCRSKQYSRNLPTASVIIPFINEHHSTLKRTFHSVINRSPRHLLKEIILVDDFSTKDDLKEPLETYIASDPVLKSLVRKIRLPERGGLIRARQAGAREATGDVLIFLDSHTEANYNWLPPLLEPIAEDYRTAVCPFIDVIDMYNFEYRAQDEGKRGSFDWELFYKRLDLLPEDLSHPTRPFKSPVMAGGLFAISAKFFWELNGYDEGLLIWGGEQYELSFKIWQCGGQMFDAPCSRVGHIYRKFAPFNSAGIGNYLGRNLKRVAEVWMDEYKEYIFKRRPSYKSLDAGDLTEQKALRERLQCKSFKWFMEEVAFDQPLNYPAVEPEDYASGYIKNVKYNEFCVYSPPGNNPYTVTKCSSQSQEQKFILNWHKDLRPKIRSNYCFDVSKGGDRAPIEPYTCHGQKGNQLWRYDPTDKTLKHGGNSRCLDMDVDKSLLYVCNCVTGKESQKWIWENTNEERLRKWDMNKL